MAGGFGGAGFDGAGGGVRINRGRLGSHRSVIMRSHRQLKVLSGFQYFGLDILDAVSDILPQGFCN